MRGYAAFSEEEFSTLNKIIARDFVCVLVEPPDFKSFLERMANDTRHIRVQFNEEQYTRIIKSFRECLDASPHVQYISSSFTQLQRTKEAIIEKLERPSKSKLVQQMRIQNH